MSEVHHTCSGAIGCRCYENLDLTPEAKEELNRELKRWFVDLDRRVTLAMENRMTPAEEVDYKDRDVFSVYHDGVGRILKLSSEEAAQTFAGRWSEVIYFFADLTT